MVPAIDSLVIKFHKISRRPSITYK